MTMTRLTETQLDALLDADAESMSALERAGFELGRWKNPNALRAGKQLHLWLIELGFELDDRMKEDVKNWCLKHVMGRRRPLAEYLDLAEQAAQAALGV